MVLRGTTKWYNAEQGFGVVTAPDGPGDVWVHFTHIEAPGFRELREGQAVEFTYEAATGGQDGYAYRAVWVRPLG